jgi:hypothetical protein
MAELFFQYDDVPYIFNTRLLKLFRLDHKRITEIISPDILRNVRFDSTEINREQAFMLAKGIQK